MEKELSSSAAGEEQLVGPEEHSLCKILVSPEPGALPPNFSAGDFVEIGRASVPRSPPSHFSVRNDRTLSQCDLKMIVFS